MVRFIAILSILIFTTTILFTGCDPDISKPVDDIISPPKIPTPLEKAQMAMERVNQRRTEAQQNAEETDDFLTVFTESEIIFIEELGFAKGFWVELVSIYRTENSDDPEVLDGYNRLQDVFAQKLTDGTLGMFYFEYIRTFDPLIVEFLRLSYEYPDENEDALLIRFTESVRNDKVDIKFSEGTV